MEKIRSGLGRFWSGYREAWQRSKWLAGSLTLLFACFICVICLMLFSLTPGARENAAATEVARDARATAQFIETDNARVAAEPTTTFVASQPKATPLPTNTLSPQSALETIAREKFGDDLIAVKLSDVPGKNYATVDYDLGSQWDEGTAVTSAQMDFIAFAPKVFQNTSVDALELRAVTDFKDALGNAEKDVAMKFTIQRALADKVNWTGIDRRRLEVALGTQEGNGVYVHPALRQAWVKSQQ